MVKPTQEQVIAWAREICGPEMPEWRDGTEMEWHEFHALALRCYEAGRKDENEACDAIAAWILKMPENDVSAAIRARRKQ